MCYVGPFLVCFRSKAAVKENPDPTVRFSLAFKEALGLAVPVQLVLEAIESEECCPCTQQPLWTNIRLFNNTKQIENLGMKLPPTASNRIYWISSLIWWMLKMECLVAWNDIALTRANPTLSRSWLGFYICCNYNTIFWRCSWAKTTFIWLHVAQEGYRGR